MKNKLLISTIFVVIILCLVIVIIFLSKRNNKGDEKVYVTHDVVVHQIEELGNLEVVKYNIQDMMDYEMTRRWLPNSKASIKIVGEVIACVDLTKIAQNDIFTDKDSVSIVLPIPEICHYKVDHSKSKVYNVDYGLWETADLIDEAYKTAELHIYKEALNMGIAKESRENAQKVLIPILSGLGFTKINISFKSPQETFDIEKDRSLYRNTSNLNEPRLAL